MYKSKKNKIKKGVYFDLLDKHKFLYILFLSLTLNFKILN